MNFSLKIVKAFSLLLFLFSSNSFANSILCTTQNTQAFTFSLKQEPSLFEETNKVSILTWNAHKFQDEQFISDLKKISFSSDILFVQEAMHSLEYQQKLMSEIPFAFTFFKSFCLSNEATGVMTASRFQSLQNISLLTKGTEPISFTPKVSGYSQLIIKNKLVHVLNTHALNFNLGSDFQQQIDQLTTFLSTLSGPVIWSGDFNTWSEARIQYLIKKTKAIGLTHVIPKKDDRFLKLDHIFVRQFQVVEAEVLNYETSDHYPIKALLQLDEVSSDLASQ